MQPKLPKGIVALAILFIAGALISALAGASLLLPQSEVNQIWRFNPKAQSKLVSIGVVGPLLMISVSLLFFAAFVGLLRRSRWGYNLAVFIIGINFLADLVNVVLGTEPRAIIGLPIAGVILFYLLGQKRRSLFLSGRST